MSDATGAAEALLGLPGFRVLEVHEEPGEVIVVVELVAETVGCPGCGVVARAHGRSAVDDRDLAAFGRPARPRWRKRRFSCEEPACAIVIWSESSPAFSARCLLTDRAGLECCLQVGSSARRVARLARAGVWRDTVMAAVGEHGEPLIDDPGRIGEVRQLGVDETSFAPRHRTRRPRRGNSAAEPGALARWAPHGVAPSTRRAWPTAASIGCGGGCRDAARAPSARCARTGARSPAGEARSWAATAPAPPTGPPRPQRADQEGEARRPRLRLVHQRPAADPAPRRRHAPTTDEAAATVHPARSPHSDTQGPSATG